MRRCDILCSAGGDDLDQTHIRRTASRSAGVSAAARLYFITPVACRRRGDTRSRCVCWAEHASVDSPRLLRADAARRLHASSSSGRWRRQDPMTAPRRADARRGFFVRFDPLPHAGGKVGRVGHVAACLTSCYSIIVPDGGTRSRTSSPPDGGDYTLLCMAYIRTRKTTLHLIGSFFAYTAGRCTLTGRTRRRRTRRECRQGVSRDAGGRLHRAPMCAGAGGSAANIGRDGTSAGDAHRLTAAQLRTRSGVRRAHSYR